MLDAILWFVTNVGHGFVDLGYALTHPSLWLGWIGDVGGTLSTPESKEALARFIYYGASHEFFFVLFDIFLVVTVIGMIWRPFLWGVVRGMEAVFNTLGRLVAWVGLIMVLQQIVVIFLQGTFRQSGIEFGLFGFGIDHDVSWWSEELKLYNAMIICLCIAYTFIQGGHVRVDLVYATVRYRTKKVIDMFGALLFMVPMASLMWLYSWFFMWRNMVLPNPNASATLDRLMTSTRAMRWKLETIGFSPNGFDKYYMFKVLTVALAGIILLNAVAYFWRSYLNFVEGEASDGKYLDKDTLGEGEEAYEGTH